MSRSISREKKRGLKKRRRRRGNGIIVLFWRRLATYSIRWLATLRNDYDITKFSIVMNAKDKPFEHSN